MRTTGQYGPGRTVSTRSPTPGISSLDSDVTATDLVVRAVDADGNIVATSHVWFKAPDEATIDLAVSGAVAGQPSEYDRVVLAITPLLADLDTPRS